jgi:hypothetical protein
MEMIAENENAMQETVEPGRARAWLNSIQGG